MLTNSVVDTFLKKFVLVFVLIPFKDRFFEVIFFSFYLNLKIILSFYQKCVNHACLRCLDSISDFISRSIMRLYLPELLNNFLIVSGDRMRIHAKCDCSVCMA